MRYTTFGRRTGLRISEYALGTANFGTSWGSGAERGAARAMFDRFAEAGGTFLDTADVYQHGESERFLGDFLAADRDHFVLATKFAAGTGGVSRTGNSRKAVVCSLEESLRRLRTDHVDVYWAHFPDHLTPGEEIARAFDDLVRAGKILYGGFSNFPAWRTAHAAALADLRGWAPIAGVQLEYSLAERTAERELLPMAEALGLGATLWSPLGGGLLTGKYRHGAEGRLTALGRAVRAEDAVTAPVLDAVLAVAGETGATPGQVAMAWLRERAGRATTSFTPIIGPRTPVQLEEYLGALEVTLTAAQYDRLARAGAVAPGMPHELYGDHLDTLAGGDASRLVPPVTPVV